ncbi:uncharacterized protein M6B38_156355 [Iris pallida]|uniref:GBF-interacting protein 1 N-terminal domain-containing protein n=1 Tax=Iris pallida TaxID=29817 RepID=A0AAX6F1Z1_IRIPA|nr:uncharacterized protein M6B38_156355 [Iris pallida]
MVQSIREIVNCSEMEIYSMLKECNMDPSEAVHRLLTQDTFHEVKSKREKKKETKDIPESRSRALNNSSNRGPRGGADRGGRVNVNQISPNDYGAAHGKLAHKKENGAHSVPPSSVVSNAAGSNLNRKSPMLCEVFSIENATDATGTTGGLLPSQPSPGFENNWSRAPGQLSMADIVKMGKPQGKPSSTPTVASDLFHPSHDPVLTNVSQHNTNWPSTMIPPSEPDPDFHTSQGPVSQDEEISHELGTGQHSSHDGWSLADKMPTESGTDQTTSASSIYADPSTSSTLLPNEVNLHLGSHTAENEAIEGHANGGSLLTESVRAAPSSDRVLEVDKFGHGSDLEDGMLSGINSYHSQVHAFEHHEVVDTDEEISSAAENLQQLNLHKGELGVASVEDNPAVIIPSHLQVTNADCSHLSFGSFGSGMSATFSGSFPSQSLTSNLEVAPVAEDAPSFDQSHSRTTEYYDNDQLESSLNENMVSRSSPSSRSYDILPAIQPDTVSDDTLDAAHRIEGNFPSVSGYGYSATTQQTAATYAYPESNAQMQNLSPFSSLMQPYTDSLPSSLLAQTAQQPLRELDHPFSALLPTQSMPLKYSTTTSSISGPAISIPEVQSEVYSTPQSTLQTLPNTNILGGGPALPQHLPLHPYSQPTLPLGHFANMIGYPFLPQSYTFLPSAAYQQAYAGNSPFNQSPVAGMKYTLPQYKSSVPGTSLPQSPALPPGYGGLSNSTSSIPGSFSLNPSAPASTTPSIDEAMSSLYKEGSHYLPLQQNENSAMWLHGGAGSRAMSALPASTFYGYQGQQNQHNGGYRQVQQQASPYGPMGYMNFYQSQGGPTQEQHQQNPSEGNLSGSQGPTSHQLWQHGY